MPGRYSHTGSLTVPAVFPIARDLVAEADAAAKAKQISRSELVRQELTRLLDDAAEGLVELPGPVYRVGESKTVPCTIQVTDALDRRLSEARSHGHSISGVVAMALQRAVAAGPGQPRPVR